MFLKVYNGIGYTQRWALLAKKLTSLTVNPLNI